MKLAEHFVAEAARTHHKPAHALATDAREALVSYTWPGNIRELRNVMERAVILSRGETIDLSDLPDKILATPGKLDHSLTLEQMERRHIEADVLPYCQANQITIIAYTPLGSGRLARHSEHPSNPKGMKALAAISATVDKTLGQVALNWCTSHPNVIAIPKSNSHTQPV